MSENLSGPDTLPLDPVLPIATAIIKHKLVASVIGAEDPNTGVIVVSQQWVLPPLVPGGLAYMQELAKALRPLGPAVVHGQIALCAPSYVDELQDEADRMDAELLALPDRGDIRTAVHALGNALQPLVAALEHPTPGEWRLERTGVPTGLPLERATVERIVNLVQLAREQLIVDREPAPAIDAGPDLRLVADLPTVPTCMYCGCREDRACLTPIGELGTIELMATAERYANIVGADQLPDLIPCWWVSTDPHVCSAYACMQKAELSFLESGEGPSVDDANRLEEAITAAAPAPRVLLLGADGEPIRRGGSPT